MTPLHHLKRSLATLLALGLILLVSLFVVRSLAGLGTQPATNALSTGIAETTLWATNTPQGQEGAKPATPTLNPPTAAPAATGKRPPACTFPLADIKPVESQPKTYIFSEPRIVLASQIAIGIASWLPDSERLLITRQSQNGRQIIETINYHTGETKIYAEREGENGKPIWLSELDAIAYATAVQDHYELWISDGGIQEKRNAMIVGDVSGWSLATDGKELVYFSPAIGEIPQIWNLITNSVQESRVDLSMWEYPKLQNDVLPLAKGMTFSTTLQPNGTNVAFYGRGWFFLLDKKASQVCEVDLEQYAVLSVLRAAWSPNGRYIAMIVTPNPAGELVSSSNILVLDLYSGKTYRPMLESPVVRDIAWADDSQYLAGLVADPVEFKQGSPRSKIYLIHIFGDVVAKEISTQLYGGGATNGWLLAWSPNGKSIAVKCPSWIEMEPTIDDDHICIIEVYARP